MTVELMRRSTAPLPRHATSLTAGLVRACHSHPRDAACLDPSINVARQQARCLAHVRDDRLSEVWFTGSYPRRQGPFGLQHGGPERPPDERTLKMGKTIRTLHSRLPTLLTSPLPAEILSPQITLYLFPSTHPHLPTVSGRIAYSAALWTAPVAWGRVPVVGNVKLIIMSERVVKNGSPPATPHSAAKASDEKLVVKWKTCGKSKGRGLDTLFKGLYGRDGTQVSSPAMPQLLDEEGDDKTEFSGLFVFEFDEEGRIVSHTIEYSQQGGNWEKMTRVATVTDWLLGRAKWRNKEPELALGFCESSENDPRKRLERRGRDNG